MSTSNNETLSHTYSRAHHVHYKLNGYLMLIAAVLLVHPCMDELCEHNFFQIKKKKKDQQSTVPRPPPFQPSFLKKDQ